MFCFGVKGLANAWGRQRLPWGCKLLSERVADRAPLPHGRSDVLDLRLVLVRQGGEVSQVRLPEQRIGDQSGHKDGFGHKWWWRNLPIHV